MGQSTAALTVNGIDLFLDAANSTRTQAELEHDFELSRVRASLVLSGLTGGRLSDAVISPTDGRYAGISKVLVCSTYNSAGYDFPLPFSRKDVAQAQDQQINDLDPDFVFNQRYPADYDYQFRRTGSGIVQVGGSLFVYPLTSAIPGTFNLNIEGYGKLNDYTSSTLSDSSYTDLFLVQGYSFMKWAICCELNYYFQRWVARQEGVIPPPEQYKMDTWKKLVDWDTYLIDSSATSNV